MASQNRKGWLLFNFELSPEQHTALLKTARRRYCSAAALLRLALSELLEKYQKEDLKK